MFVLRNNTKALWCQQKTPPITDEGLKSLLLAPLTSLSEAERRLTKYANFTQAFLNQINKTLVGLDSAGKADMSSFVYYSFLSSPKTAEKDRLIAEPDLVKHGLKGVLASQRGGATFTRCLSLHGSGIRRVRSIRHHV